MTTDRRILVRRAASGGQGKAKERDEAHGTAWRRTLPAFVFSCPAKLWDALNWNCNRNGERPAATMRAALEMYLKHKGWKEPPPRITATPARPILPQPQL